MIHLRLTVPHRLVDPVLALLQDDDAVVHVVRLPGVVLDPPGDAIFCDVPKEQASVVVHELRELGLAGEGGIVLETGGIDVDDRAARAERRAPGAPADAVLWEDVEAQSGEAAEVSWAFVLFMALGAVLATVALAQNSSVLMVGAMVVGPEFGPIAAACVALVNRRGRLAARSAAALAVGLPLAVLVAYLVTVFGRAVGLLPQRFAGVAHGLASTIASPDGFTVLVALVAGAAGLLSLTTAKSGAIVGVLVSVTTLPAAANVGLALAYGDGHGALGSLAQLALNVAMMFVAGVATLLAQRAAYRRRLHREARRVGSAVAEKPTA
ncbi:DUF389 domain-containing protein [Patulibacter sp. SYSU D01012]|uniref:DUF389 domain-containing protein n=1 Tax=Patulibacter sp. SYSU D01012 TaxID=2817381 RepID=UPI001B31057F